MIRTFVAIDLPAALRRELARLQDRLRRCGATVSWVRPQGMHLTLKFLGDIDPARVPEIDSALRRVAADHCPFRLQPRSCGAFPSLRQIRVLWAGLDGPLDRLSALQTGVETALEELGFARERRPFKAHLTLGRVKLRGQEAALAPALVAEQSFSAEAFDVAQLVLYRSELSSQGARYSALAHAPLGG